MANLKVELVKSLNGRHEKHIATANSMGLRKIGDNIILVLNAYGQPHQSGRSPAASCCSSLS